MGRQSLLDGLAVSLKTSCRQHRAKHKRMGTVLIVPFPLGRIASKIDGTHPPILKGDQEQPGASTDHPTNQLTSGPFLPINNPNNIEPNRVAFQNESDGQSFSPPSPSCSSVAHVHGSRWNRSIDRWERLRRGDENSHTTQPTLAPKPWRLIEPSLDPNGWTVLGRSGQVVLKIYFCALVHGQWSTIIPKLTTTTTTTSGLLG